MLGVTTGAEPLEKRKCVSAIREESMGKYVHTCVHMYECACVRIHECVRVVRRQEINCQIEFYFSAVFFFNYSTLLHFTSPLIVYPLSLTHITPLLFVLLSGLGEKPDHLTIKATVNYIKHDSDPWYVLLRYLSLITLHCSLFAHLSSLLPLLSSLLTSPSFSTLLSPHYSLLTHRFVSLLSHAHRYTSCPNPAGCLKKVTLGTGEMWNCEKCNLQYDNVSTPALILFHVYVHMSHTSTDTHFIYAFDMRQDNVATCRITCHYDSYFLFSRVSYSFSLVVKLYAHSTQSMPLCLPYPHPCRALPYPPPPPPSHLPPYS